HQVDLVVGWRSIVCDGRDGCAGYASCRGSDASILHECLSSSVPVVGRAFDAQVACIGGHRSDSIKCCDATMTAPDVLLRSARRRSIAQVTHIVIVVRGGEECDVASVAADGRVKSADKLSIVAKSHILRVGCARYCDSGTGVCHIDGVVTIVGIPLIRDV